MPAAIAPTLLAVVYGREFQILWSYDLEAVAAAVSEPLGPAVTAKAVRATLEDLVTLGMLARGRGIPPGGARSHVAWWIRGAGNEPQSDHPAAAAVRTLYEALEGAQTTPAPAPSTPGAPSPHPIERMEQALDDDD